MGEGQHESGQAWWRKDLRGITILLMLYTLQGIPMGLVGSIPLLLQTRGVGYAGQAVFSFVRWPYSLKLLWAPIVDFVYSPALGRRRSWVIPTQYAVGLTMMAISFSIDELLLNVRALTAVFLALYFLVATQDIAVDGWALTMLSRENVGLASTCNTIGQSFGYFTSYTVFLALNSEDFCNAYLRRAPAAGGVVSLSQFLFFWGLVFLTVNTWILLYQVESTSLPPPSQAEAEGVAAFMTPRPDVELGPLTGDPSEPDDPTAADEPGQPRRRGFHDATDEDGDEAALLPAEAANAEPAASGASWRAVWASYGPILRAAYREIFLIAKLPVVRVFAVILVTARVGFVASERISPLKLLDKGFPKEHLAFIAVALLPLELILPVVVSKLTNGPEPLSLWLRAYPARLALTTAMGLVIVLAPNLHVLGPGSAMPLWVYASLIVLGALHRLACNAMFVAQMAFFAKVSDPRVGATYMTLLNTLGNLGNHWPAPVYLQSLELTSRSECRGIEGAASFVGDATCSGVDARTACKDAGGYCFVVEDSFPWILIAAAAAGIAWILVARWRIVKLQAAPRTAWEVKRMA